MVTMGLKDSSSQNETPRHLRLFENENALKILLEDLILKIRRVFILFFHSEQLSNWFKCFRAVLYRVFKNRCLLDSLSPLRIKVSLTLIQFIGRVRFQTRHYTMQFVYHFFPLWIFIINSLFLISHFLNSWFIDLDSCLL